MNLNPLFIGLACAVALFWAIGAYGRLMRLRGKVKKSFAALDAVMLRELTWMQARLPPELRGENRPAPAATLGDESRAALTRLWSACEQLAAVLAQARQDPCQPPALESLAAAHDTLGAAWQRAIDHLAAAPEAAAAPDLPDAPEAAPGADSARAGSAQLAAHRMHLLHQSLPLREAFNAAVLAYNRAIAQFPASLLARACRLRAAGTLRALSLPL